MKTQRKQENRCWCSYCWRKKLKKWNHDVCIESWMSSCYSSGPCIVLYIEDTVAISLGYGEGKRMGWRHMTQDTNCSSEQLSLNTRSQQLAFPAKPFPFARKYQEVAGQQEPDETCTLQWAKHFLPNATNPAKELMWELLKSVARHTWSEQATDQALNRARDQYSPHWNFTSFGKIHYFHYCYCSTVLFWPNKRIKYTFLLANNDRCDRKISVFKFSAAVALMSKEAL